MKCQCCRKKDAVRYDFRTRHDTTSKYRVCSECFNRPDKSFFYWYDHEVKI